jgi:hypothetical protein
MDRKTFFKSEESDVLHENYQRFKIACHRAGQDIVIPQLIQSDAKSMFRDFAKTHLPLREFDSTFAGSTWGEREPIKVMAKSVKPDYFNYSTENFAFWDGGSPDHSLKYRGYFMYHPCGYACWSQRLYEAMAVYTVPIIVTDGTIQAFERFIDWRKFTVKIGLTTWTNTTALRVFRSQIRSASDAFRTRLLDCWKSLNISTSFVHGDPITYTGGDGQSRSDSRQRNDQWLQEANRGHPVCSKVLDTLIWKKTMAISRVLPWLDFSDVGSSQKIHAFRLLTLEMWCQVKMSSAAAPPKICGRRADFTARIEYV